MDGNKKISVLMGIYNCESTLEQAVNSIKNQTYKNWQLILCDDGSTDNTLKVAEELKATDDRIIVIKNETNVGLNKTLNNCLKIADGEYIARMDGDDDCLPNRFEKQIIFLESHPEYDIVSSYMTLFDETGEWGQTKSPEKPTVEEVVCSSPICHAPVMMRKACIDAVHGYTEDKKMLRVEDVNLWIKLYTAGYRCYNIQEPLYRMRNDQNALNRRKYKYRINSAYVRIKGCKELKLSKKYYFKACTPLIAGLVPASIRKHLSKKKYRNKL